MRFFRRFLPRWRGGRARIIELENTVQDMRMMLDVYNDDDEVIMLLTQTQALLVEQTVKLQHVIEKLTIREEQVDTLDDLLTVANKEIGEQANKVVNGWTWHVPDGVRGWCADEGFTDLDECDEDDDGE